MNIIVPGRGPANATWMIVGEAPGREEAARGRPFCGKSGQEQDAYLARHGLNVHTAYITNVVKLYIEGNPDPTPGLVEEWSHVLEAEIKRHRPKLIAAVGRFAARWFLGDDINMEAVHGIPHHAGAFDPERSARAGGAVVVPCYHPAFGLYNSDMRALIARDYKAVADCHRLVMSGRSVIDLIPHDIHEGTEHYIDVTGKELALVLSKPPEVFGYDTEGTLDLKSPWSLQVSLRPGAGMVLRYERPDFHIGIKALNNAVWHGSTVAIHNAMFDVEMSRVMGFELRDARWWDTMYAAYLLRLEPQALKPLAYRWEGMRMDNYADVIADAGRDKQAYYLMDIVSHQWPKYEGRMEMQNDGSWKWYKPRALAKSAEAILCDLYADHSTDATKRWDNVDPILRKMAEDEYGPMPEGTLADVDLADAVRYSCRDADAALRLYHRLRPVLKEQGLDTLMKWGMEILPVFEEMQYTGMHCHRPYFQSLYDEMTDDMVKLQSRISTRFYKGEPFNPASSDKVAALMRRRGLEGEKKTSTGKMSTAKKSIEHLRHEDDALGMVIDWRERQKVRDTFCVPVLERIPISFDGLYPVRCRLKTTRVTTRRLASEDPNLLAMPTRSELGRRVRDGYICPPGYIFGAWDLSQIELRYLAHVSGDATMRKRYTDRADIHRETAAAIFNIAPDKVDKDKHRAPAKNAGFGIVYGISGSGLFDQLRMMGGKDWSVEKCDDLIERWLNVYPGVREYKKEAAKKVRRLGMVRDCWGMIRYLNGAWSDDRRVRAEAERIAVSHEVQGGAQGMIQNSMRWLRPHIRQLQLDGVDINWILQIHDEIIIRMPEEWFDIVDALVHEALTQHHGVDDITVPVESSGSKSTTWGGLK